MAYTLHIERNPQGFSLDEWVNAVGTIEGVKLADGAADARNPTTGESISISGHPGDVSVLSPARGILGFGGKAEWRASIRFSSNRASFKATPELDSVRDPLRIAVSRLAAALGARIVGDEGEVYEW